MTNLTKTPETETAYVTCGMATLATFFQESCPDVVIGNLPDMLRALYAHLPDWLNERPMCKRQNRQVRINERSRLLFTMGELGVNPDFCQKIQELKVATPDESMAITHPPVVVPIPLLQQTFDYLHGKGTLNDELALFWLLATLHLGTRKDELLTAREDENGNIVIQNGKQNPSMNRALEPTRTLAPSPQTLAIFRRFKQLLATFAERHATAPIPEETAYKTVCHRLNEARKKLNLPKEQWFTIKSMRHMFADSLQTAGKDKTEIASCMGHSSLASQKSYLLTEKTKKQARRAKRLAKSPEKTPQPTHSNGPDIAPR